MGIFDVFSNSKATSTQNDDTQSAQTTVQDPAATPVTQPDISDEFSKFASTYNPKADPLDLTNFDNAVQGNTNPDFATTDQPAQPMMVPQEPTLEPVTPVTESQLNTPVQDLNQTAPALDPVPESINTDFQMNNNSQTGQPTQYQPEKTNTEAAPTYTTVETNTSPLAAAVETLPSFDNPVVETPVEIAQSPSVQAETSEVLPEIEAKEFEEPDLEESKSNEVEQSVVEFGVSPTGTPVEEKTESETPLTPEFKVSSVSEEEPVETATQTEATMPAVEGKEFDEPELEVTQSTPQVRMLQTGITPKETQQDEVEKQEKKAETVEPTSTIVNNYESEDTSMIGKINLVNIKKLGFLGLNSTELNEGLKMDLFELSEAVGGMLDEYILDSSMGYTQELLKGLSNKELSIKSYVLKSAYSLFTQEPFTLNEFSNFTSYIFSDALERLKNIIGSSDALVLVYSPGMNNLMSFFSAMGLSTFYKEIGKPFVLLGNEWEAVINSMITNKLLDQSITSSILIASDSNELLSHLQTLDNNFKKLSSEDTKTKVVDLRKEDDELIYLK